MDLAEYTTELQALVIRSVLEWVYESARGTLVITGEPESYGHHHIRRTADRDRQLA
jgi:hypothetical protein